MLDMSTIFINYYEKEKISIFFIIIVEYCGIDNAFYSEYNSKIRRVKLVFILENLLRNDYFPEELPPCFNSNSLADHYEKFLEIENKKRISSVPLIFSGFKNNVSRRKFAIPNPYQYICLANILVNNSDEIFKLFNPNKNSLTVPVSKEPEKYDVYIRRADKISDTKKEIKKIYKDNLYEIRIDIQSFFDSIYTHSISWAIHTKKIAKKNRTGELLGNKIDHGIQSLNSSQTNGILTGNALSRIVSEIILCAIDKEINKKIPNINYVRFVDDYFIFVKDRSQIDSIISCFQQELAKYELVLNENKLNILESPFVFGNSWVEQMKVFASLSPQVFLEKTIIEYHEHQDIAILKYGLKVLRTLKLTKSEWKEIEPSIINILVKFPNLAHIITLIIKNNEENIDRILLKKSIYTIIDINLKLNNDEEPIWAIWLIKVFNISISLEYIETVMDSENWLAIIILLDAISNRKNQKGVQKLISKLRGKLKEEYFADNQPEKNMYSEVWLLAYEADRNRWLNTGGKQEDQFIEARKNSFFKELKKNSISFYDGTYKYDVIKSENHKNNIYVTYRELIEILEKFKETIFDEEMTQEEYEAYIEEVYDLTREHIINSDNY